jgi:hypothetical protein
MPIDLITSASGRSRFLLEDAADFKFFWTFDSSNPRPDRTGGWNKRLSFSRETKRRPIACHPYKAERHCTHCVSSFLTLAFLSSIAFTIYCSMADITVHTPAAPSANVDDSGHDSGAKSTAMAASSSPTRGATKMRKGKSQNSPASSRRRPSSVPRPWMIDR